MPASNKVTQLRQLADAARPPERGDAADYRISAALGATFLGRGRSGRVALLVPLVAAPGAVGRSGGGFTLSSSASVVFEHHGVRWEQPAAILECSDDSVEDAFLVLAADLAHRIDALGSGATWRDILSRVEEWQALLGKRSLLSAEEQLGLWGELWLIKQASRPDEMVAAWRGPSGDPIDFFCDGVGLEVKTSRRAHLHRVSQTQVDDPSGEHESYLISIWVGNDPVRGDSLGQLVECLLARVEDPATLLRKLALAGYSPQDHREYSDRYVALEAPTWFHVRDVPRVRAVDNGISELRYLVALDASRRLDDLRVLELWRHFGRNQPFALDARGG